MLALAAFGFVFGFWICTLVAEVFLDTAAIVAVKHAILRSMIVFLPVMVATAITGKALAGARTDAPLLRKKRRMPFIALNGLLVLLPAAAWLDGRAQAGMFDITFYAVQALELCAGAVNIALLGLNIRDGLRLARSRAGIDAHRPRQ